MRADLLRAPTPQPRLSGVHERDPLREDAERLAFLAQVQLLADVMLRLANESKVATWCLVELFPLLKPYHWAAYAREAEIPTPSRYVIDAAQQMYRQLIQYPADAQPVGELFAAF